MTIDNFAPGRWIYNGFDIAKLGEGYIVWRLPAHRYLTASFEEAIDIANRFGYSA